MDWLVKNEITTKNTFETVDNGWCPINKETVDEIEPIDNDTTRIKCTIAGQRMVYNVLGDMGYVKEKLNMV